MEDRVIIDLYNERNEVAIDETAKKYGTFLLKISNNILVNREDSEECVSDTYLKVWDKIPPEKPSYFRAWLARITRNLSIDKYRSLTRKKRSGDNVDVIYDELADCIGKNSLDEEIENKEIAKIIDDFLDTISLEAKAIFIKRYFFGADIKTIANEIGSGEGKVKSSLHRTRIKLHDALTESGVIL